MKKMKKATDWFVGLRGKTTDEFWFDGPDQTEGSRLPGTPVTVIRVEGNYVDLQADDGCVAYGCPQSSPLDPDVDDAPVGTWYIGQRGRTPLEYFFEGDEMRRPSGIWVTVIDLHYSTVDLQADDGRIAYKCPKAYPLIPDVGQQPVENL